MPAPSERLRGDPSTSDEDGTYSVPYGYTFRSSVARTSHSPSSHAG